jgi:hypothetical protein
MDKRNAEDAVGHAHNSMARMEKVLGNERLKAISVAINISRARGEQSLSLTGLEAVHRAATQVME